MLVIENLKGDLIQLNLSHITPNRPLPYTKRGQQLFKGADLKWVTLKSLTQYKHLLHCPNE